MAISTAADVITEIRALWSGVDTSTAQSYLTMAVDKLCYDLPIIVGKYSLKLTAGTQEYTFGSGAPWYAWQSSTTATTASVIRIESASYRDDSTSYAELLATVPQQLDNDLPGWRFADSGTPNRIYTYSGSTGAITLGLYPAPDTSNTGTGATYPRIDFVTRNSFASTFSGAVTIPSVIRNPLVLAYGALWQISTREDDGETNPWLSLYMREVGILNAQLAGMHRDYKQNVSNRPKWRRQV